jgi:hypothetical protein
MTEMGAAQPAIFWAAIPDRELCQRLIERQTESAHPLVMLDIWPKKSGRRTMLWTQLVQINCAVPSYNASLHRLETQRAKAFSNIYNC